MTTHTLKQKIFMKIFNDFCVNCGNKKINEDCSACFNNKNALKTFEEEE